MEILNRYTGEVILKISSADLSSADLRSADLSSANLRYADLSSANLRYANLRSADLSSANLRSADLSSANLRYADINDTILPYYSIIPEGSIYGYKKIKGVIIKLLIPKKSKRINSLIGRKCRTNLAKVISLSNGKSEIKGGYDLNFIYKVGEYVTPNKFDDDIRVECSYGIHFFITKEEAENY